MHAANVAARAFCATVVLLLGCNASSEQSSANDLELLEIQPLCQAGCVDPDPSPQSPGVHLGFAVTPPECFGGQQDDLDADGMGDYCEKVMAEAFAPRMRFAPSDDVRRQSYWAARPLGGDKVRIFYAVGYYVDLGVPEDYTACVLVTAGQVIADCDGHSGDSEAIILDIYWMGGTVKHWVLDKAQYSYHGRYNVYSRGLNKYPKQLTYGRKLGADPVAYVAKWKHSNYKSDAECDAGNGGGDIVNLVFDFDDCPGNTSTFLLDAFGSRNLGSDDVRLLDCVTSEDPMHEAPPRAPECFWSASNFYGWQLDQVSGEDPTGYGALLRQQGF